MKVTDYTKIKKVTFKVPALMCSNAEEEIRKLAQSIHDTEELIYSLKEQASRLEESLDEMQTQWSNLTPLMDIEYETSEVEEVKGEINVGFNFDAAINKHIH